MKSFLIYLHLQSYIFEINILFKENGTMTTQFDYLTLNIIFNFIKHQMEWHVTKGKYEIKLPFYMLLSINNLPVKLKKERKSEIAEKTSQSLFQLPYQKFSSPPHL